MKIVLFLLVPGVLPNLGALSEAAVAAYLVLYVVAPLAASPAPYVGLLA